MGAVKISMSFRLSCLLALACPASLFIVPLLLNPATLTAQAPASANRIVGAITAIDGKTLTIKSDSGASTTVSVSDTARVLRTAPGAKTLAGATPISFSDLAVGDRVLVMVAPATDGSATTATTVIAMKQADIAEKQQADKADWQRRGVGGLVKSVDASTQSVTVAAGAKTIVVHTTAKTIVRRYDPESIEFSAAKPSSFDQIHSGDQLRARGERSADGAELTAEEIIAGSFRNISGTVISVDPSANTVSVTDLATKKPVVIHVNSDSQVHKLSPTVAQGIAARMKNAGGSATPGAAPGTGSSAGAGQGSESRASAGPGAAAGGGSQGQRGGGDLSQVLQRAPVLQISDLHKGDAVMIVATQGTPAEATAVTLLAGVEPILTASPTASQSMFSASWTSIGGGGAGAGDSGTP
jgi:Domain of unknown function (DUF5666)